MAFLATSQTTLQSGFNSLLNAASVVKSNLTTWQVMLTGNITGIDAVNMMNVLTTYLANMATLSALPGMQAYAQAQFANPSYDVGTEYTNMVTALTTVQNWLKSNIPSNAVSVSNGVLVGSSYTPAQTAALLALVNTAATKIA